MPGPDDHFRASPHSGVNAIRMGALTVLVAVQLSVLGLYLPPVFENESPCRPRRSFHCRSRRPYVRIGQMVRVR